MLAELISGHLCLHINHLVCAKKVFLKFEQPNNEQLIQERSYYSFLTFVVFFVFFVGMFDSSPSKYLTYFSSALLTDRASQDQSSGFQIFISHCARGLFHHSFHACGPSLVKGK